jgi:hypothetical protein
MRLDLRDERGGATPTFLYDFPNKDLGEPCYNLCNGHGHLLAEALLNYLPRRRVRTWAFKWFVREVVSCHTLRTACFGRA